jgi:hypothetical protein
LAKVEHEMAESRRRAQARKYRNPGLRPIFFRRARAKKIGEKFRLCLKSSRKRIPVKRNDERIGEASHRMHGALPGLRRQSDQIPR